MISFCTCVGSFDSSKLLRRVSKKTRRTAAVKRTVSNLSSNKTITGKQNMNFLTSQQIYLKRRRKKLVVLLCRKQLRLGSI